MTNAIAIVAHHDDHILWIGGTIQRMKSFGWNWTVIAICTPASERRKYFNNCCSALGVIPIAMEFQDYRSRSPKKPYESRFSLNSLDEMRANLVNAIQANTFDWVFTHSPVHGEYGGHANHFEVAEVVTSLVREGKLTHGLNRIAYFSYRLGYDNVCAITARPDASYYLKLTYQELRFKCEWCLQAPDVDTNLRGLGFPCPNPEAFEGEGLQLPEPFMPRNRLS